ncbi:MAG: MucBP domain-containing protein [Levilactobacillus sp.]|uniref:MucBP domain-containing protein n=1 Tax=Levilactobacillus sp. TaxID=2767919 RepID=UPI00258A2EE7|nr:MucBP domain-containing protein [Levilactobacillus sp.]MCI1553328.1 MucBP domain-containing protein [Levilactobacillus sp.]MCI1598505.1 MucBP domain-containing protein [Levilactobacillus sp.]MCI1605245.1 MucBP domain-containing protein [Levilactobacillus sp.]
MFKQCDASEHYKMYKKGKAWVFAGILTTFCLVTVGGTEVVHADTLGDAAPSSSQPAANEVKPTQQVVLKSSETPTPEVKDADQGMETPEPAAPESDTQPAENQKSETPNSATPDTANTETPANKTPDSDEPAAPDAEQPADPADNADDQVISDQADEQKTGNDQVNELQGNDQMTPPQRMKKLRLAASPTPQPVVAVPEDESVAVTADQSIDEWMPNKRLQQAILNTLQSTSLANPMVIASGKTWSSVNDITQDDMALLSHFSIQENIMSTYIDGKNSFSLEGLQYAVNLTYLDLKGNTFIVWGTTLVNYSGPSPDGGHYFGDITDISPLRSLTKLEFLQLALNRITDVTPIADLKNLVTLQMPYNCVSDFSSLNYAQYTDRMTFDHQLIIHDPIIVDGKTRTATTPITIKWPQNFNSETMANKGYGWMYDTQTAIYSFESAGVGTPDGNGHVVYTGIPDQVMPGSTATVFSGYKTTQLPYKYYLSQVYFDKDSNGEEGVQYFSDYTPYTIGEEAQPVTVHYQDTAGKAISDDLVLAAGLVGEQYTTTPLAITGYTLTTTPANASGVYGDEPIDIIYVYTKDAVTPPVTPTQTITVTVHHQTADGTQVAPDVIITGKAGDTYTTSPAVNIPAGYELVTTPANATGTMSDIDIVVTYLYAKTETDGDGDQVAPEPDKPTKPTKPTTPTTEPDQVTPAKPATPAQQQPGKGGQANRVTIGRAPVGTAQSGATPTVNLSTAAQATPTTTTQTTLPQTDERTVSPLWGLALLGGLLGLVGLRRKQH